MVLALKKQSFADAIKIGVLKNFANFKRKHLFWSLFFNKVAGLKACKFITKGLQHRCFPVKFAKFLRTSFFTEHLRWLLALKKHLPTGVRYLLIKTCSNSSKYHPWIYVKARAKWHSCIIFINIEKVLSLIKGGASAF